MNALTKSVSYLSVGGTSEMRVDFFVWAVVSLAERLELVANVLGGGFEFVRA